MVEILVVAMTAVWLDEREEEERGDWYMTWARAISLAARSAWVLARRVAFAALMLLVAAWSPWYPAVPVVPWLHMSLSAALK
jgi:hypothetical protein